MGRAQRGGAGGGGPTRSGNDGARLRLPAGDVGAFLTRHSDLALAGLVVAIVAMMIVPLPAALLDVLLALNIAGAVTLLLVSIYVSDALRIATFPTLLLLTTLFRLALEVSASRLILLRANAGAVIHAFGTFVVAGNLVVGAVIFVILTIIQFVVISKGAERVAEVAARFTLDALPGRQMAIDAELRAGHIDRDEARRRRASLARESQLFGSMDGAMKFVKGDAVAGIIVLAVNIIGGLAVGVLQRGLDVGAAARAYTLLTIGSGLVAQIPALVISTAAGIVVTRVAAEDEGNDTHLGREIARQVLGQPKAIAVAAVLLAVLALVPGLPLGPFLVLAAALGLLARALMRAQRARRPDGAALPAPFGARATPEPLLLPLELLLGPDLAFALCPGGDDDADALAARLADRVRGPLFTALGLTMPRLTVRRPAAADPARPALSPAGYEIRLDELPRLRGELPLGSSPVDPADVEDALADQLSSVLERWGHDLIGIEEAQALLARLERTHPALVREVVPRMVSPAVLADVLRRLVEEGISLRNLKDVLGALADRPAAAERDPAALTEHVRVALRRSITHSHTGQDGAVPVLTLDPMIEEALRDAVHQTGAGSTLGLEPQLAREILESVTRAVAAAAESGPGGGGPVILASADVRRHVRRLIEAAHPRLAVLSHLELAPEATVRTVGRIQAS